ncbi:MAG: PQQ-binding-like beta-propeller repeat protein [Acidimicrobiales bacterium]|nr:PQQ-binding-like beta-propeller repeat protein [Acidimicrobiales bacterium]
MISRVLGHAAAGVALIVALLAVSLVWAPRTTTDDAAPIVIPTTAAPTTTTTFVPPTTTRPPYDGWVDPLSSGEPWGTTVEGLLTFRGNPTRSYYGAGPVPTAPAVQWSFPAEGSLCSFSSVGGESIEWCGTGWTGQPAVLERDGRTWVAFGSYGSAVHFLDGDTGERILPDFPVGDIIKGSVTIDPDGYPLLYTGSRDNFFRVLSFDTDQPVELWKLSADAVSPTLWNNDWDGAALVIDDYLFEGGENSQLHIVKLNRGYDDQGRVTVAPELVFNAPGWDQELLDRVGRNVSIENSVAISGDTLYFANSGGLVQGWDISGLADGTDPERVFRYWAGDDIDASIVIDGEGMLYIGVEYERANSRSQEVGQIIKLDPSRPDDPLVWKRDERPYVDSGVWGTPALYQDVLIVGTDEGRILALDQATGEERWSLQLNGPTWQSPVIVDDVFIIGDCEGVLHAYDVADTTVAPTELWTLTLGGCIESTPAVWDGWIYVGTRAGKFFAIADDPAAPTDSIEPTE